MSEIAEKEFAGEIYLAVSRLNELVQRAAKEQHMRTVLNLQIIHTTGAVSVDHITATIYKLIPQKDSTQIER